MLGFATLGAGGSGGSIMHTRFPESAKIPSLAENARYANLRHQICWRECICAPNLMGLLFFCACPLSALVSQSAVTDDDNSTLQIRISPSATTSH
jgi:hypothetical protein